MEKKVDFYGALAGLFEYEASKMFTSIPATVVGIKSLGEKRIDVQPSLQVRTVDGETNETLPSILNVPLHMPLTSLGGLSYPISVGDSVLLVFSQSGIDNWKRSDGFAAPSNMRKFDASDAIAIAGVHPFSKSPNNPNKHSWPHSVEDVVLVHNLGGGNETEVRLLRGGGVVVNTNQDVVVNSKNTTINAGNDVEINSGESTIINAGGDVDVKANGNASVKSKGWGQMVSEGSLLIKSEERLRLVGGGSSITL